jgi:Flp pilus assembly protein TadG
MPDAKQERGRARPDAKPERGRARPDAKQERGQATLELALCLPFAVLLLAALVEVGGIVGDEARLTHAAREAARVAAVDNDAARIRSAAEAGGLEGIELAVTPDASTRVQGEPVTVSLTYPPVRLPLLGQVFSSFELHAEATMRIEKP